MSLLKNALTHLINFFFQPICPLCKRPVSCSNDLCADCFKNITFIQPPICHTCGHPLGSYETGEILCPTCLNHPPFFTQARSVFIYNSVSKKLILSFKHTDALFLTPLLGTLLLPAARDMAPDIDIIMPVPLHWKRLLKRRYNQSAELSRFLSKKLHKPCSFALKRIRHTKPQGHFDASQRRQNVKNAFHINRKYTIQDKRILLIDDVYTTGATLNACAAELLKAGALSVSALTLSKTVKNKDILS